MTSKRLNKRARKDLETLEQLRDHLHEMLDKIQYRTSNIDLMKKVVEALRPHYVLAMGRETQNMCKKGGELCE